VEPPTEVGSFDPDNLRVFSRRGHHPNMFIPYLMKKREHIS
jgi:hypothetical protein